MRVDLQSNVVTILPAPGGFDPAVVPPRVREVGFDPGEMRLAARGAFVRADGRTLFRIEGGERTYPVAGKAPAAGPARLVARVAYEEPPLRLVPSEDR